MGLLSRRSSRGRARIRWKGSRRSRTGCSPCAWARSRTGASCVLTVNADCAKLPERLPWAEIQCVPGTAVAGTETDIGPKLPVALVPATASSVKSKNRSTPSKAPNPAPETLIEEVGGPAVRDSTTLGLNLKRAPAHACPCLGSDRDRTRRAIRGHLRGDLAGRDPLKRAGCAIEGHFRDAREPRSCDRDALPDRARGGTKGRDCRSLRERPRRIHRQRAYPEEDTTQNGRAAPLPATHP